MFAVEVHNLRKEFRRRKGRKRVRFAALKDISFTMERGETVAILGQNGSGKSTLVRLLATLLLHDGGSARIFGHDVFTEPRPVRKLITRVSVEASFFKKMSAAENLSYARALLRHDRRRDAVEDPGDPHAGRLSRRTGAASRWRTSPAACSRRSRWRERC